MEYIEKIFKKTGWISILESVIFAILGTVLVCNPEGSVRIISYILGAIFIIAGVYKMINYFAAKGRYDFYNYDFIYGILAIIIGLVTIMYNNTIGAIFRVMIGLWVMYSALIRASLAFKLKTLDLNVWVYTIILAILMFICGLYITLNTGTVIMTIGVAIIVYSVIDIIEDIIFMKNVKEIF